MNRPREIFLRSAIFAAVLTVSAGFAASASAAPFAYTANYKGNSVSVINTATNAVVGSPIPVGKGPYSVAVTPDGRRLFVANAAEGTVSVIDTASRKVVGEPIVLGGSPTTIAISPDGRSAYVSDEKTGELHAIDTRTDAVIATAKGLGKEFEGTYAVAVAPDGKSVWVSDNERREILVLDPLTLAPIGNAIPVGKEPAAISFTPDGKTAYVSDYGSDEISVIDTATRTATAIKLEPGAAPWGLGMTGDGRKLFVSNYGKGTVDVIETTTNKIVGDLEVGEEPYEFGMSPDGKVAYLAEFGSEDVLAIDTTTNKPIGEPIEIAGGQPWQVVVAPDQSPTAAFAAPSAIPGVPATFDGAASTDPDGSVVSWVWAFGDGGSATGVTASHTYGSPGSYAAKLGVVDNEGCGEALVFTGRTALCSGGGSVSHTVAVASPPAPTVVPSNKFRFRRLVHNRRNGTARLQVKLPAAGSIVLAGPKVHMVRKKIGAAGSLWLTIHARVKLNKKLKQTLRAKVRFRVTFTPTGGTPKTTSRSIVLQRAPRKKHHVSQSPR